MSFWSISTGEIATGSAESSHVGNFQTIPDGTQAPALIKEFLLDEYGNEPFYNIQWKIVEGDFKGRIVFQKIKCFCEKDSARDRALNMLKRIFDLLGVVPPDYKPGNPELMALKGRVLGIKIGEWKMKKDDGSLSEGNFVREVHKADTEFETVTGVKCEAVGFPIESALIRNASNAGLPKDSSDIPF